MSNGSLSEHRQMKRLKCRERKQAKVLPPPKCMALDLPKKNSCDLRPDIWQEWLLDQRYAVVQVVEVHVTLVEWPEGAVRITSRQFPSLMNQILGSQRSAALTSMHIRLFGPAYAFSKRTFSSDVEVRHHDAIDRDSVIKAIFLRTRLLPPSTWAKIPKGR